MSSFSLGFGMQFSLLHGDAETESLAKASFMGAQVLAIGPISVRSIRRVSGSPETIQLYDNAFGPNGKAYFSQVMSAGDMVRLPSPLECVNGVYVEALIPQSGAPELVQNGNFDTDVSGWAAQLAGAVVDWIAPGRLRLTATGSGRATQTINGLIVGQSYIFAVTIASVAGTAGNTAAFRITTATDGGATGQIYQSSPVSIGGSATFMTSFVATATSVTLAVLAGANLVVQADSISLKAAAAADGSIELELAA